MADRAPLLLPPCLLAASTVEFISFVIQNRDFSTKELFMHQTCMFYVVICLSSFLFHVQAPPDPDYTKTKTNPQIKSYLSYCGPRFGPVNMQKTGFDLLTHSQLTCCLLYIVGSLQYSIYTISLHLWVHGQ